MYFLMCMVKQVELSHPNAELRLLEVFYHKIYKVRSSLCKYKFCQNLDEKWTFYCLALKVSYLGSRYVSPFMFEIRFFSSADLPSQ